MSKKNLYYAVVIVAITAAVTIAITLKLSRSRSAPPVSGAPNASLVARATTPVAEPKGEQKEAIKVHGHWTINVRNPDGTLVTHQEFENALTPTGVIDLAEFLGRVQQVGYWQIDLSNPNGPSPWLTSLNDQVGHIYEPSRSASGPNISTNLSLCVDPPPNIGGPCSVEGTTAPIGTFLLGGHIAAQRNGTIAKVSTMEFGCNTIVSSCGPNIADGFPFTDHPLAPLVNGSCPTNSGCEVNVGAGQIIQVTVVISFS